MGKQDFEDFLMEKHAAQYVGAKDAMVDDCESWLQDLEVDEFIEYGNMFAKKQSKELLEALKGLLQNLHNELNRPASILDNDNWEKAMKKAKQAITKATA